ncbi:MAG: flagellar export chaperone FlgN [Gemmatimonadetes bacterium]|nr:flagellar export chaperone FlgN [Gemmatimonadota bacterium]
MHSDFVPRAGIPARAGAPAPSLTPLAGAPAPVRTLRATPVAHTTGSATALADALRDETRLLESLAAIMRAQRDAVGTDDIDAVDQSVFATHRVLVNLNEARRRRRQLNHLLGEGDDLSVPALEEFFGGTPPADVRVAADALADAGRALQREVEINRRVLRQAIERGDRHVRTLAGAGADASMPRTGGSLLDRRI